MSNYIDNLDKNVRMGLALTLGLIAVYLASYGVAHTKADVMFSDVFHSAADIFTILLLWLSFSIKGIFLQLVKKLSGLALLAAGVAAIAKGASTLTNGIITGNYPHVEGGIVLLLVSLSIIVIIYVQMQFVGEDHETLHGDSHQDNHSMDDLVGRTHNEDKKSIHLAAKTELITDMVQALGGTLEFLIILTLPHSPMFVRGVDIFLTIIIGIWMIYRGNKIMGQM